MPKRKNEDERREAKIRKLEKRLEKYRSKEKTPTVPANSDNREYFIQFRILDTHLLNKRR